MKRGLDIRMYINIDLQWNLSTTEKPENFIIVNVLMLYILTHPGMSYRFI